MTTFLWNGSDSQNAGSCQTFWQLLCIQCKCLVTVLLKNTSLLSWLTGNYDLTRMKLSLNCHLITIKSPRKVVQGILKWGECCDSKVSISTESGFSSLKVAGWASVKFLAFCEQVQLVWQLRSTICSLMRLEDTVCELTLVLFLSAFSSEISSSFSSSCSLQEFNSFVRAANSCKTPNRHFNITCTDWRDAGLLTDNTSSSNTSEASNYGLQDYWKLLGKCEIGVALS